jgi:hypothetical protein
MPTLKTAGAIACGLMLLVAAACGGSANATSPSSPSAVTSSQTNSQADVSAPFGNGNGKPNGNGGGNGNGTGGGSNGGGNGGGNNGGGNDNGRGNGGGNGQSKIEIEGLITAILGQVIQVSGRSVFVPLEVLPHHGSHGLVIADLDVGDRVHVRATMVGERLTATELKLQNPARVGDDDDDDDDDGDDDGDAELEGLVADRTGECPSISFTLNGQKVFTTAATVYQDIVCSGVVNGVAIEVDGVLGPDGAVQATRIELDNDPRDR